MGAMPVPQQEPVQQPQPSVAENVMPIAQQAQAMGPQAGVAQRDIGAEPKAAPDSSSKKRAALSVLGAVAGLGPMVKKINQQQQQQTQTRNQHIIHSYWGAYSQQVAAVNRAQQLKPHIEQIDQMMKQAQALPNDDPTKTNRIGYLAHLHVQVVGEIKQAAQTAKQNNALLTSLTADPKNLKIINKALGINPKDMNSPESMTLQAAMRKTQEAAHQALAQPDQPSALLNRPEQQGQPVGQSQASPGLPVPVQQKVLEDAGKQAEVGAKEDQTAAYRARTDQVKATGHGKTGVAFNQGVPYGFTAPDGKFYSASDPAMPDQGKIAMHDANAAYDRYTKMKNQTGTAAKERADAYWGNYLLHSQGVDMNKKPLAGSMLTADNRSVGSALQSNVRPTGQERQRADLAASAKDQMNTMESILSNRTDLFGPASGRKTNFTQWVGSQDPDAQRFTAAARVAADHLAGVFGGRSEAALEGIYNVIGKNTTNPKAAVAALNQMMKAATIIQKKGTVHTVGGSNSEGAGQPGTPSQNDPLGILK